jgi:hypothetical protein
MQVQLGGKVTPEPPVLELLLLPAAPLPELAAVLPLAPPAPPEPPPLLVSMAEDVIPVVALDPPAPPTPALVEPLATPPPPLAAVESIPAGPELHATTKSTSVGAANLWAAGNIGTPSPIGRSPASEMAGHSSAGARCGATDGDGGRRM